MAREADETVCPTQCTHGDLFWWRRRFRLRIAILLELLTVAARIGLFSLILLFRPSCATPKRSHESPLPTPAPPQTAAPAPPPAAASSPRTAPHLRRSRATPHTATVSASSRAFAPPPPSPRGRSRAPPPGFQSA